MSELVLGGGKELRSPLPELFGKVTVAFALFVAVSLVGFIERRVSFLLRLPNMSNSQMDACNILLYSFVGCSGGPVSFKYIL